MRDLLIANGKLNESHIGKVGSDESLHWDKVRAMGTYQHKKPLYVTTQFTNNPVSSLLVLVLLSVPMFTTPVVGKVCTHACLVTLRMRVPRTCTFHTKPHSVGVLQEFWM